MSTENTITWQHVKDVANSLTDEQLQLPVRWWSDSEGGKMQDLTVLEEDYVTDGEAYIPRSECPADAIDHDEPVMAKGTPMFWTDI